MKKILLIVLLTLCSSPVFSGVLVLVSVLPQKSIVEYIGGDSVSVEVIVGYGISPENYQPTAKEIVGLAKADLYVRTGLPFEEQLLPKLMEVNPDLRILDMREGVNVIDDDPHIWTDPLKLVQHVYYLSSELTDLSPELAEEFEQNYQAYLVLLGDLDREIWLEIGPMIQRKFLVYHPAWGYFASRYGLTQLSVEQHGREPNARGMAQLIDQVKAAEIKVIFVQPQHNVRSAGSFAETVDAAVEISDPLEEDLFASIKKMAKLLRDYN